MTGSGRRRTQGASASPQSTPESSSEQQPPASPVLPNDTNSPQSAPSGRRSSKTLQHALSFSTPGSSRIVKLRTRPKAMDDYNIDYGEDEQDSNSPKKGGHTLRRRTRVDYTSEHIDDQVVVPSSTSSTRSKKRRSDGSNESEDAAGQQDIAQGEAAVAGDITPSSRRRNPMRKSSEVKSYTEDADDDENDVQDTIEVGVSFSEDENSSLPPASSTNPSRGPASADSPLAATTALATEGSEEPSATNLGDAATESADNTAPQLTDSTEATGDPEEQLQGEARGAGEKALNTEAAADVPEDQVNTATASSENEDVPVSAEDPAQETTSEVKSEQASEPKAEPESEAAHSVDAKSQDDSIAEAGTKVEDETSAGKEDVKMTGQGEEAVDPDVSMATVDEAPESKDEHAASVHDDAAAEEDDKQSSSQQLKEQQANSVTEESTEIAEAQQGAPEDDQGAQSTSNAEAAENTEESQIAVPDKATTEVSATEAQEDQDTKDTQDQAAANEGTTPMEGVVTTKPDQKPSVQKSQTSSIVHKPQPAPVGRWAHLTPYIDGDYVTYPEKKEATPEDDTQTEERTPDEKDADKDSNDMEPMVEDNDDAPDGLTVEAPTPALNTPTRGSPVPESMEPTASNSPAPVGDDADDAEVSDSDDGQEARRYFRYRKLRDPEEYVSAIENYEDMTTAELYELLEAVNVSLVQWQTEWTGLGKIVDDYENSLRRRLADSKYESRTRNLHQHGVNYEEPEFVVKGYKAKERETLTETRYLQGQDRIMAAAYGFEYDPHPSKIGRQNPETQQVGIMTRGRSLRNQPRQTAKATEADEVTGKRTRKPVQLFDPAAQDVSRSSTPVPTRTRRRRNGEDDGGSVNGDGNSDADEPPSRTRRRRGQRPKTSAPNSFNEDYATPQDYGQEDVTRSARRGRVRPASRYDEALAYQSMDDDSQRDQKHPKRHLLTLKIPRGKNFSEPSSAITDNGDSRPSTASSESSSHTAESSYSFRPKRQKRFRDEQDEVDSTGQAPPKKRGKRSAEDVPGSGHPSMDSSQGPPRKAPKIKVVRAVQPSRNGTPSSVGAGDGDEPRKDYKLMTKSEKMSASMKSKRIIQPFTFRHCIANAICTRSMGQRKHGGCRGKAQGHSGCQEGGPGCRRPKGRRVNPKEQSEAQERG